MHPIRTILCPIDFSLSSTAAMELACSLAKVFSARLILLHTLQAPVRSLGGTKTVPPLPEEIGRREAEEKLRAAQMIAVGINVDPRLQEGDAATQILSAATESPCDLIVMGTHGRTGLGRLLMGSVAEAVLRKAPCPVITMKSHPRGSAVATAEHQVSATK